MQFQKLYCDDEIRDKDIQKEVHYDRADFMDWTWHGADCIWSGPFDWTLSQVTEQPFIEAIRPQIVVRITTAWRSIETQSLNKSSGLADGSLWPSPLPLRLLRQGRLSGISCKSNLKKRRSKKQETNKPPRPVLVERHLNLSWAPRKLRASPSLTRGNDWCCLRESKLFWFLIASVDVV